VIKCRICKRKFKSLTNSHLKSAHRLSLSNYKKRFPGENIQFAIPPCLFPKKSQVFINWKKSLKKRGTSTSWNRGFTKETHPGVLKISQTMRRKKINNFAKWQAKMIKLGKIRATYSPLEKSKELAFLIGLVLGDGNIGKFPRTECLTIALNTKYPKLIDYTDYLLKNFFEKQTSQYKTGNCLKIRIYQKQISKRLKIPSGSRKESKIEIPKWIWKSQECLVWYLKGLFEAEGSLSIHLPTCTYNFQFSNKNKKLLNNVGKSLEKLNFHPEYRENSTRLRKKKEVEEFKNLIFFRDYNIAG
jgi:hypothetical protein